MTEYFSEENLLDAIRAEGIDKLIFNVPMRPLHAIPGFPMAWTESNDESVLVPCKIDTSRYDPFKKYKITMKAMIPGYGHTHYYTSDFVNLINLGQVAIRGSF